MSTYFNGENTSFREENKSENVNTIQRFSIYYKALFDKIQFYLLERWLFIATLTIIFILRLIITKGYHAVTYCIGIHILNSLIGFISPLNDPEEEEVGEGSFLPTKQCCFWALLIGNILTFIEDFNVPVHWPLLLVYFILIFFLTMNKQIKHMIKYKYLPWNTGKTKYGQS